MTLIKNPTTISRYPYHYLGRELVDKLIASYAVAKGNETAKNWKHHVFKLLECYCHLNNQRLEINDLESHTTQTLILNFFSVLKGNSLISTKPAHKAYRYEEIKRALMLVWRQEYGICPDWLRETTWSQITSQELNIESHQQRTVLYWSGWPVKARKEKLAYLDLTALYHSHGEAFTVRYYERWRDFIKKQAVPNTAAITDFAHFLAENSITWPPSTFENPIKLTLVFKDYLTKYFLNAHENKLNLNSQIKKWNRFISNVYEVFIDSGIWPAPFGAGLPRISTRPEPSTQTRVSVNENGISVHNKLITEVPLEYTDDQAIEILFKKIAEDLKIVQLWAQSQSINLRFRQLRRKSLSKNSNLAAISFAKKNYGDLQYKELPTLCAKFEYFGFFPSKRGDERDPHSLYGTKVNKMDLASDLGLPTTDSLFPFMCLLVLRNPKITPSFLYELELFNKNNQICGFTKTDFGYQLTGYKNRRKKKKSEQKIFLCPRSAVIIRQIIEITKPLRDYLKAVGDDNWRRLFLTCGRGFSYPKPATMTYWKKKDSEYQFASLNHQFSKFTNLKGQDLRNFVHRITLGAIRSSRAVQIYLATKSVEEMARSLGHAKYSPTLLRHYLPDSILAFFQTRWIRIFQKAFVCEAMKNSPYILRATNFNSMTELNIFLKNHLIKDIPSHLSDPTKSIERDNTRPNKQVLISVDKGILTALISLQRAVSRSTKPDKISGLAKYWSEISWLIEEEINQSYDRLLKEHLKEAKRNLAPGKMEALIYDTAY